MSRSTLTNVLLVVLLVALVAVSFVLGSQRTDPEESFAGTDATVTGMLEEDGAQPWFEPFFSADSAELESGLFALQAGLGGAVFGYCVGVLNARDRRRRAETATPAPADRTA